MAQKLMPERIDRIEEGSFSKEDVDLLKNKRNKQLLFLLSGYLPFIAIGIYILIMGPDSLNTGRNGPMRDFRRVNIDGDQKIHFWTVAPYFIGFLFILLNIYFIKLYFQSLRPLIRDIKRNKKQLIFYKPAKNPMTFFNKYFLSSPLYQNQQIEISKDDFESINDTDYLVLEIAPDSIFILRLLNGTKEIMFY